MAEQSSAYRRWMKENFVDIIQELQLSDVQKKIIERRWLDQLLFFDKAASSAKRYYYLFRVTAIIGGVLVPLIASLRLPDMGEQNIGIILTSIIGSVVAAAGGLEGFLRYGDQMRQYRQSAEMMKIEGWSFFGLSGEYAQFDTHAAAFEMFSGRVEDIVRLDVRTVITKETKKEGDGGAKEGEGASPSA